MLKRIAYIALIGASVNLCAQTAAINGHSFLGGTQAATSGLKSSNYLDGIIPSATITVYLFGTQTLATIYADGNNTPLTNPFTSNTANSINPGGYIFWAAVNQAYDVVGSGGIGPNAYPQPIPLCTGCYPSTQFAGGSGTVTSFAAPSGSWPTWLVPTVTDATTTPTLAVAAGEIPPSQIAPSSTNGQVLTTQSGVATWIAPTGSGATGGSVAYVDLTNQGSYTVCPTTVTFTGGGTPGEAATASPYCTDEGDNVVLQNIILTDPGYGYTSTPTITISGGTGSGGTAVAEMGTFITSLTTSEGTSDGANASLQNGILNIPYWPSVVTQITGPSSTVSNALTFTGSGVSQSGNTFTFSGGSSITWPSSGDLVISNASNSPSGLPEVDGDCALGAGGAWTTGACSGSLTGAFLLAPSGSQSVVNPSGTGSSFSVTNTGNVATGRLFTNTVSDVGQGYNLGNSGTSATGWSTGGLDYDTCYFATRGIYQCHGGVMTKDSQGDTAGWYMYQHSFGGKVAASDEGIQGWTDQVLQTGFYTGTVSSGTSPGAATPNSGAGVGAGGTYTTVYSAFTATGNLNSVSVGFATAPTSGAVLTVAILHPTSATAMTLLSTFTVTLSSATGVQTFTSGTDYAPINVSTGDQIGLYCASGCLVGTTNLGAGYYLVGAPASGSYTALGYGVAIASSVQNGGTGASSISVNNFTCNYGDCTALAGSNFADGGLLLDKTQGGGATATLGEPSESTLNGMSYPLTAGTVAVSSAWGNIVGSSCTNNGNGQYQVLVQTTCNVTLGTSPASPGNFVVSGGETSCSAVTAGTSLDIGLAGPFQEEAYVVAVGAPSSGVQSITFCTRYAWNNSNATLVMQGGPVGQSFVATGTISTWPVAYAVVGATTSTNLFFSNCITGTCNGGSGLSNDILPSGTPVTFYPSAFITGSANGSSGTALLGTNSIPFTLNDAIVGAPTSEYQSNGISLIMGQSTPNDFSQAGTMFYAGDIGPVNHPYPFFTQNVSTAGPSEAAFEAVGSYTDDLHYGYRPQRAIIYEQGGTSYGDGSSYDIFEDNAGGGVIAYTPSSNVFTINGYAPCLSNGTNCPSSGSGTVANCSTQYAFFYAATTGTTATCDPNLTDSGAGLAYAGTGPSQLGLTYNSVALVPGSSATAVYGVNSSGQAVVSEAGGTAARVCDAANGVCSSSGTVTSFAAPSASWPTWLVPTVTDSTTTPSLAVAASAIPNGALANPAMTVNGTTCTLGASCAPPAPSSTVIAGDVTGTLGASTVAKINNGTIPASAPGIATNSSGQPIVQTSGNISAILGFIPVGQPAFTGDLATGVLADYSGNQGSGTTVLDTSGANACSGAPCNAIFGGGSATAPTWGVASITFTTNTQGVQLPAGVNSARSFVIAGYWTPITTTPGGATSPANYDPTVSSSLGLTGDNFIFEAPCIPMNLGYTAYTIYTASGCNTNSANFGAGFHIVVITLGTGSGDLDHIYLDGTEVPYNGQGSTAGLQTSGNIYFGTSNVSPWTAQGGFWQLYRARLYSTELTAADVTQATQIFKQIVSSEGVITSPPQYNIALPIIHAVGDSRTAGQGVTTPWPSELSISTLPSTYTIYNWGVGGATMQSFTASDRYRTGPYCSTNLGLPSIATVQGGVNDFNQDLTVAEVWQNTVGEIQTLKRAGCIVFITTEFDYYPYSADLEALNALRRQYGVSSGANAIMDLAANPLIGAAGSSTSGGGTYFQSGGLHVTQAGTDLEAAEASNAINAFFGSTASAPTIVTAATYSMTAGTTFISFSGLTTVNTTTLPDCLGQTGALYTFNNPTANVITVKNLNSAETINGTDYSTAGLALTGNTNTFLDQAIGGTTAGCQWVH